MKKGWLWGGLVAVCAVCFGWWMKEERFSKCRTCYQNETQFFQLFSKPTVDATARERKFLSFVQQTCPSFRVAVTEEEAAFPDVQQLMGQYPEKFARLPGGYSRQEVFYRWLHSIPSEDIVVLFAAHEALEQTALERLKNLYKGSAAWLSFQGDIKKWAEKGVLCGYASLFQKIKLADFLEKGIFSAEKTAEHRLFELAGKHVRRLRGSFVQGKNYGHSWVARSRHPYPRFRPSLERDKKFASDLVIFSSDRPLQLFALLESVDRFVSSLGEISVIYQVSSSEFDKGYDLVKEKFPKIQYLKQEKISEQEFKPLLLKAAFQSPSPYLMFATDDAAFRETIDIQHGIDQMEKFGAFGIYYRLGKQKEGSTPPSVCLENGAWGWQFSGGEGDWKSPHTLSMALYRKEEIKKSLTALHCDRPQSMENKWALKAKLGEVGIYYDQSKVVTIPLSCATNSRQIYSKEELLSLFLTGLKLDVKQLEMNAAVSFVPREEVK